MMDSIRKYAIKFNAWLSGHWRMVIWCMLMVMMMQQCTISRLRWEVGQLTQSVGHQAPPPSPDSIKIGESQPLPTPADSTAITADGSEAENGSSAGNGWLVGLGLVIVAGLVIGFFYMKRNAIYPIGIVVLGKFKQDFTYHIKVKNTSHKPVEVSEPLVTFIMGGTVRKFRANVAQLPQTLTPGTTFEADINLMGLIRANIELTNAKAIGMSIVTNGKRHSTIPTPVKIKTA